MPYAFVLYPTPLDALVRLTLDAGVTINGVPYVHPSGRPGQVCSVFDGAANGVGAALDITAPGMVPFHLRGILWLADADAKARLEVDDYQLQPLPAAPTGPEVPPVAPDRSPEAIINAVYDATRPNLATHDGCGQFTEDCCTALHNEHSQAWGHIAKEPAQNQYNGHAVDALMLLGATADTVPGIYDIIFSSVSPAAKPAFNYVEPPKYELWYYPAAVYRIGVTREGVPVLRKWD